MTDLQQMLETDVLTLGMAADQVRRAQPDGRVVTFVRVHTMTPVELATATAVPEAASEVRLYATPGSLDEAIGLVRALARVAGGRRVSAFSMADLDAASWAPRAEVLPALVAAGLHDLAELPVDQLDDLHGALAALRDAGIAPQRLTVAFPVSERRLEVLEDVRQALAAYPSLRRFAPLARVAPVDRPTTGYDDVRMVALARLALPQASIEVDWSLHGPKLAQVALTFGADHLDAVAATSDPAMGTRRGTVEDVERNIRAAGFEPKEDSSAA